MAIGKDQALVQGVFYPTSDKNVIYRCQIDDTIGFLKVFVIFSGITGIFTFLIMQSIALLVVPLSWTILVPWLVPKYYRFIQINKHVITFGSGSIFGLIRSRMKSIYFLERKRYNEINYIRLDRWERKKLRGKMESFGRIEIKINDIKPIFHILIQTPDLAQLVEILEAHRFHSKVKKTRSRGELLLVFSSSS